MKRGGPLQRKTPLKATAGLKPGGKLRPRSTTRRSLGTPDPRWRSRAYLDWVKRQPCVLCGKPADDPHHLKGTGNLSGAGLTAPDWAAMPVCRAHHDDIHRAPALWPMQWQWALLTLFRALDAGILTLGEPADPIP